MGIMSNLNYDSVRNLPGETAIEKLENIKKVLMKEPSVGFMLKATISSFWPEIREKLSKDPEGSEQKLKEMVAVAAALFGLSVEFSKISD